MHSPAAFQTIIVVWAQGRPLVRVAGLLLYAVICLIPVQAGAAQPIVASAPTGNHADPAPADAANWVWRDQQAVYWASSCVTCHGAAKPVSGSIIPGLAGVPAPVIVEKMKAYANGDTPGNLMQQIARGYDEETLMRIGQWYAHLTPEAP